MTKYAIYQIKEHDTIGRTKPILHCGFFNSEEEAIKELRKYYNNGEKKRYDNDFYGWHYWYWDEIYAIDTERPIEFYDMDDYIRDLVMKGEWDKLAAEQKDIILRSSPLHSKLYLALKGKVQLVG